MIFNNFALYLNRFSMKEQLESLNSVTINFGENGMTIVNILLAFVMFGVALGIKFQTFKDILKKPKSVIVGLILQWVCLPLVTFLLALVLNPFITPMIALGMILVALTSFVFLLASISSKMNIRMNQKFYYSMLHIS